MSLYSEVPKSILSVEQDCGRQFDQFTGNKGGISGDWGSVSMSGSQALVLDSERGELVKSCGRVGKKSETSEAKTVAALKSHSEAERRRRERINAHLATLRGLVPSNEKMDKATLLAEVISQVKQLQKNATQVSESLFIPLDSDEVRVEQLEKSGEGTFTFKASLCCNYRPGLLSDLKKAINSLPLTLVRSEISTLGGRLMNVFFFTSSRGGDIGNAEACEQLLSSVHQALNSILDKFGASSDYLPELIMFPNKRQKVSYFESSSSSS